MGKYNRFMESQYGLRPNAIDFTDLYLRCEKCGHQIQILDNQKAFCKFCGRYVFKNKKEEFNYRLKENQIRLKRGERK